MLNTTIDDKHWEVIIRRIKDGTCVPFLGAAVNLSNKGLKYEGLPLGSDVALRMVAKFIKLPGNPKNLAKALAQVTPHKELKKYKRHEDLIRLAFQNLARVALHIQIVSGDYRSLTDLVKDIIPDTKRKPSPLLKALVKLPFKLIITTNYDRLLERAFALYAPKRDVRVVVQPTAGFRSTELKQLEKKFRLYDGAIVYKIHGSFVEKTAVPPLVITEDDYIQFLTIVGMKDEGIPQFIKDKIADSTLLFLGYGLEDWDFRTIFKGLVETLPDYQRSISFAIQRNPMDFWIKYWEDKKVVIHDIDLYEFAKELERKYKAFKPDD